MLTIHTQGTRVLAKADDSAWLHSSTNFHANSVQKVINETAQASGDHVTVANEQRLDDHNDLISRKSYFLQDAHGTPILDVHDLGNVETSTASQQNLMRAHLQGEVANSLYGVLHHPEAATVMYAIGHQLAAEQPTNRAVVRTVDPEANTRKIGLLTNDELYNARTDARIRKNNRNVERANLTDSINRDMGVVRQQAFAIEARQEELTGAMQELEASVARLQVTSNEVQHVATQLAAAPAPLPALKKTPWIARVALRMADSDIKTWRDTETTRTIALAREGHHSK